MSYQYEMIVLRGEVECGASICRIYRPIYGIHELRGQSINLDNPCARMGLGLGVYLYVRYRCFVHTNYYVYTDVYIYVEVTFLSIQAMNLKS